MDIGAQIMFGFSQSSGLHYRLHAMQGDRVRTGKAASLRLDQKGDHWWLDTKAYLIPNQQGSCSVLPLPQTPPPGTEDERPRATRVETYCP